MNLILGRSKCASKVFGTAAPDTGNTEILAHYGTQDQKRRYLDDLMEDRISSCYSMTEPQGGADPTQFKCRARRTPTALGASMAAVVVFGQICILLPGALRHG